MSKMTSTPISAMSRVMTVRDASMRHYNRRFSSQQGALFPIVYDDRLTSYGIVMQDSPTPTRNLCTVIYDGTCRFCVRSKERIEWLSRSDGPVSVRFIPYQSLEAQQVLGSEYRPGRPDAAYLLGTDGSIYKGLDAFLPLLQGISGGRLLVTLLTRSTFKPIADRLYGFVARNRYRWFGAVPLKPL